MPTITVERPRERVAVLRAYRLRIDGREIARLKPGERVNVEIEPGRHALEARVDFNRTTIELDVPDGNDLVVECKAGTTNPLALWANLFRRRHAWLRLEVKRG